MALHQGFGYGGRSFNAGARDGMQRQDYRQLQGAIHRLGPNNLVGISIGYDETQGPWTAWFDSDTLQFTNRSLVTWNGKASKGTYSDSSGYSSADGQCGLFGSNAPSVGVPFNGNATAFFTGNTTTDDLLLMQNLTAGSTALTFTQLANGDGQTLYVVYAPLLSVTGQHAPTGGSGWADDAIMGASVTGGITISTLDQNSNPNLTIMGLMNDGTNEQDAYTPTTYDTICDFAFRFANSRVYADSTDVSSHSVSFATSISSQQTSTTQIFVGNAGGNHAIMYLAKIQMAPIRINDRWLAAHRAAQATKYGIGGSVWDPAMADWGEYGGVLPTRPTAPLARHAPGWDVPRVTVAAITPVDLVRGVDHPDRGTQHASRQSYFAAAPIALERPVAMADVRYPDIVPRPKMPAAAHLDATRPPPAPERTIPFPSSSWPDRVPRPSMPTAEQLMVAAAPVTLERTLPLADSEFPDRVPRPAMRAEQQLVSTSQPPAPERTLPMADSEFPERVPRPAMRPEQQLATTSLSPAPERALPMADARFPDEARRGAMRAERQPFTTDVPQIPQPLEQTGIGFVSAPDAITRPTYRAERQQPTAQNVSPEMPLPPAFVSAPDRPARALQPAPQHPWTTGVPPKPEETSQWVDARFPDRVPRPAVLAAHQPYFATSPQPERVLPLIEAEFPERAPRALQRAEQQPSFATASPPFPLPLPQPGAGYATYPDRFPLPATRAERQPFFAPANVVPEVTSPTAWSASFPDRVPRPVERAEQQPFFAFWPFPLPNAALTQLQPVLSVGPDRPSRSFLHASQHQAHALAPSPIGLPILQPILSVVPDAVLRYAARAERQWFAPPIAPAPERVLPLIEAEFPERVQRPAFAPAQQLATTSETPKPEQAIEIPPVTYPDRVPRPPVPSAHQPFFASPVAPEVTIPMAWTSTYPDRFPIPGTRAERQPFFSAAIAPVVPSLPDVRYPDRATRAAFHAVQQLVSPIQTTIQQPLMISPSYPDRFPLPGRRVEAFGFTQLQDFIPQLVVAWPDVVLRAVRGVIVDRRSEPLFIIPPKPIPPPPPFPPLAGITSRTVGVQDLAAEERPGQMNLASATSTKVEAGVAQRPGVSSNEAGIAATQVRGASTRNPGTIPGKS